MSFFAPREPLPDARHAADDPRTVDEIDAGDQWPAQHCIAGLEAKLNEIRTSIAIQNEGFENLVRGSQVSLDEVVRRAPSNWYVEAAEAQRLGLIQAVI